MSSTLRTYRTIVVAVIISVLLHISLSQLNDPEVIFSLPSGNTSVNVSLREDSKSGESIHKAQQQTPSNSLDERANKQKMQANRADKHTNDNRTSNAIENREFKSEPKLKTEAKPKPEPKPKLENEPKAKQQADTVEKQKSKAEQVVSSTGHSSQLVATKIVDPMLNEVEADEQSSTNKVVERKVLDHLSNAQRESDDSQRSNPQPDRNQSSDIKSAASTLPKPSYTLGSSDNPEPVYPSVAYRRGWEGTVVIGVNVNEEGDIDSLLIIESSHFGVLDYAAYETVRDSWKFRPAYSAGKAVASYIEIPVTFSLR